MAGAIVCFVLAGLCVLGALTIFNHAWTETQSAIHELQAFALLMSAAVLLSSALVLAQLDRIRSAIEGRSSGTAQSAPSVNRYKLTGVDRDSGLQSDLVLEARNEEDARAQAERRGLKVRRVQVA